MGYRVVKGGYGVSVFPHQRAPMGWNNAVTEADGDHALVGVVGPQAVAAATEGAEVLVLMAAPTTHFLDVINVSPVEGE